MNINKSLWVDNGLDSSDKVRIDINCGPGTWLDREQIEKLICHLAPLVGLQTKPMDGITCKNVSCAATIDLLTKERMELKEIVKQLQSQVDHLISLAKENGVNFIDI